QKQKKLIMLPSETMIWQPEFTDKTLSRKPGAVQIDQPQSIDDTTVYNRSALLCISTVSYSRQNTF
ncbi:hypothetical protein, partial [Shigella boydii]|uniref:hypothetical protein n=1 Tax=Shigella boydii TaxID=621 RepID=UPI001C0A6B5A